MVTAQSIPLNLTPEYSISIGTGRKLYINCQQWENGQKFLNISKYKSRWSARKYLPNILLPHGVYKFVAAVDEVIRQLQLRMEESEHPEGDMLATQIVADASDCHYNFELSAWHQKGGEWHFNIKSVPTSEELEDKKQHVYFPFSVLPELRQEMVKMLMEHDGSEPIDEMPKIPEWATREEAGDKEGNGKSELVSNESAEPNKMQAEMDQPKLLATFSLPLGPNLKLYIECAKGRSGQKTIEISVVILPDESTSIQKYLPKILVPQEAYKFLGVLDQLIGLMPAKVPANPPDDESPTVLASQIVEGGLFYDFQLSVLLSERDRHWHLHIRSVKTVQEHWEKGVYFPLWASPELRNQMAKMLVEHDGTQPIDEMPKIPKWATRVSATPKIKQQKQQPNVEQEQQQVTEKKAGAGDDEDCPCCAKGECWRHPTTSSKLTNNRPFRHAKR